MGRPTGKKRKRVAFQVENRADAGGGSKTSTWTTVTTFAGELRPVPGRESVEGGRLNSQVVEILVVRSATETRAVTTAHRAVVDGIAYQIRSITNPDQRNAEIEMVLERGVGL